jgi:hypothetical protein
MLPIRDATNAHTAANAHAYSDTHPNAAANAHAYSHAAADSNSYPDSAAASKSVAYAWSRHSGLADYFNTYCVACGADFGVVVAE